MLPLKLDQLLQPNLTEINRLPARAPLIPFPSSEAIDGDEATPWRISLDGEWHFQLVANPDSAPADWLTSDAPEASWRTIRVPGVWTRQETGDTPHYANWMMPFDCKRPPDVPDENPTGLYRKSFEHKADWQDRNTVLHIGGFESVALVWCNGAFVGMGKDSRLPSEFDLSPYLVAGKNILAIMVIRWSDATWIEDQDHWNHGGLHRSVYLESRGAVHVADLTVTADYDAHTRTGTARIKASVNGASDGYKVRGRLLTSSGGLVEELPETPVSNFDTSGTSFDQLIMSHTFHGYDARFSLSVPNAAPWSAEAPTRYQVRIELVDPAGFVCEAHTTWIGFRNVDVSDRRLRINGSPVILHGVNRHDHHPENGKTPSVSDMRDELLTMKQHNINAIRTAHYPNDHRLLDLADEIGFYLIDEANVECHGRYHEVPNHPAYQHAIIDRTRRMVMRDRNHPCIIGWSLGNEAGHGPAHNAAAAMIRQMDPDRFVQYEGAVSDRFMLLPGTTANAATCKPPDESERVTTDIVCPMYPSIEAIVKWARWAEETKQDDRPLIMCEYSHAMGNSNGSLTEYVDAFYAEPALGGGFIWDWRDQGLAETDADGNTYWAYGGHFGEKIHDGNFNINGLVGPDGTPHPALKEFKWAIRPVTVTQIDADTFAITNRRAFLDTSDLRLTWSLQKNGTPVETGRVDMAIKPGETEDLHLPLAAKLDNAYDWHILFQWHLRDSTDWAQTGHLVAWDQVTLSRRSVSLPGLPAFEAPPASRLGEVMFGDVGVEFDADNRIQAIKIGNQAVISGDITASVWRAPTDNDGGKPGTRVSPFPTVCSSWVEHGLNELTLKQIEATYSEDMDKPQLSLHRSWQNSAGDRLLHISRLSTQGNGLRIDEEIITPHNWRDLPRIGIRFEVPKSLSDLSWYGLGPDESYPDRCKAQTMGRWTSSVADQYHPYVRPQEYGAHENTRAFSLSDASGAGFHIRLPEPVSFSARPHHDVALTQAETLAELKAGPTTEVHIDAAIRGLGTGACGPDTLPQYLVNAGSYAFTWIIAPRANP